MTAWYSIHQNKIVYRTTKTIVDMERYMLHLKQLPKNLEVISFVVYLLSRCPIKSVYRKTQQETSSHRKPNIGLVIKKTNKCYN